MSFNDPYRVAETAITFAEVRVSILIPSRGDGHSLSFVHLIDDKLLEVFRPIGAELRLAAGVLGSGYDAHMAREEAINEHRHKRERSVEIVSRLIAASILAKLERDDAS